MAEIRNILVIVDPTVTEHPSLLKAQQFAMAAKARLELFICDTQASREERLVAQRAADPTRLLDVNLKPMLEQLARPLRDRGLDVSTECSFADNLVEGLADRVRHSNADLVIKETHHHSLLQRTLITNTDWQLIRILQKPLLLTKPRPWSAPMRLIAAVDPGHINDKPAALDEMILRWSRSLADQHQAELHAVHAYVPLTVAATAGAVVAPMASTLTPEAMEFEDHEKRKELRGLTDRYAVKPEHLHLELGVPTDLLPRKAELLGADLVVMGAIARRGLQRLFIGSTAERVLERMPCDILVVKTAS